MMHVLTLLLLVAGGGSFPFSGENTEAEKLYTQGLSDLKNKNYEQAIESFRNLSQSGYDTPEVYSNLGTAYYLASQWGRSIAAYRKALRRAPADEQIRHNLNQAYGKVSIPAEAPATWQTITQYGLFLVMARSPDQWAVLLLVMLLGSTACAFMELTYANSDRQRIFRRGWKALSVLTLLVAVLAVCQQKYLSGGNAAVVIVKKTIVKVAPNQMAKSAFSLEEGVSIEVLDRFEGWVKVVTGEKREGWVRQAVIEEI